MRLGRFPLPLPFSPSQERKQEEIRQDVDHRAGHHNPPESLRRWKIGERKNRESTRNHHVRVHHAAPLLLAARDPRLPSELTPVFGIFMSLISEIRRAARVSTRRNFS